MQSRAIKSLSEQQVADLKAGRGMGLALAAELNGYPGPSHLLELAHQLNLSAGQRLALKNMFDDMKVETILIGEILLRKKHNWIGFLPTEVFRSRTLRPQRPRLATRSRNFGTLT